MVKTQPGAVGRTGRAFKEGVDGKGRGADHGEQQFLRDDLFFLPAGILSPVGAEWSDDCQAKRGDQGEGEGEASLLNVAPIGHQCIAMGEILEGVLTCRQT